MKGLPGRAAIWLVATGLLLASGNLQAQCATCTPAQKPGWYANTFTVAFASSGFSASDQNAIIAAINYWNSGGTQLFQFVGTGPAQVLLIVNPSLHGQQFAAQRPVTAPNQGGTIEFNPDYLNRNLTDFLQHSAEHELGHAEGLDHVTDPSCKGVSVMYDLIDPSGPFVTSPTSCDISAMTSMSPPPQPPPNDTPPPMCDPWLGCAEPLLLKLGDGPWRMTGLEDPVHFDIFANGHLQTIGWTARDSEIAFLALDRNGNGRIDDGSELFGNAARLSDGHRAANGFVALADFDANGDGVIDARDPVWGSLLLWVDENHDGVSQPEELTRITDSDITAIHLDYQVTGRKDKNGNFFRFEGKVIIERRRATFYDVFFVIGH
jgi:hypothetical protein